MKLITMLAIPNENPWAKIFYMCGVCGHAIELRNVEEHARYEHKADGVNLYQNVSEANAKMVEEHLKRVRAQA